MNPNPASIYSDLVDEIFSSNVKTKNEFKIRTWRRKAEKLKSVDVFQYKLMLSILDTYENKNAEAVKQAEAAILLTTDIGKKAMAHRVIGNCFTHMGNYKMAQDAFWCAYELTRNPEYFKSFFSTGTCYDFLDQRMFDMKSLSTDDKIKLNKTLEGLTLEIKKIEENNLNINVYRDVLSEAYKIYFANCSGRLTRYPTVTDSSLSSILFNPRLDLETIGLLNDEMNDALVSLLEKYDFDEILKYPVVFTSEDYSNA